MAAGDVTASRDRPGRPGGGSGQGAGLRIYRPPPACNKCAPSAPCGDEPLQGAVIEARVHRRSGRPNKTPACMQRETLREQAMRLRVDRKSYPQLVGKRCYSTEKAWQINAPSVNRTQTNKNVIYFKWIHLIPNSNSCNENISK